METILFTPRKHYTSRFITELIGGREKTIVIPLNFSCTNKDYVDTGMPAMRSCRNGACYRPANL